MHSKYSTDHIQIQPALFRYPPRPNEVVLEVVFGTPSKQCDGIGICMLLETKYMAGMTMQCPHITGFFSVKRGQHILTARFPRMFLSSQMVVRHFQMGLFKVMEPYKVPARISRVLGLMPSCVIGEGEYRVKATKWDLIVEFSGVAER